MGHMHPKKATSSLRMPVMTHRLAFLTDWRLLTDDLLRANAAPILTNSS